MRLDKLSASGLCISVDTASIFVATAYSPILLEVSLL
jgi:hypothetical protein